MPSFLPVLVCFSLAVMKHSDQKQLKVEKGLFHIIPLSHSSALKEVKTGTEAETPEECRLPAQTLLMLSCFLYAAQMCRPRGGIV